MIYTVLITTTAAIGVYCVVFWLYRDFQVDRFRQSVFGIRDELFDFAASGRVDFDEPAYQYLRSVMNGYIRFGHRVSLMAPIMLFALMRKEERRYYFQEPTGRKWAGLINELPTPVALEMDAFRARARRALIAHLFLGSPALVAVLAPAGCLLLAVLMPIGLTRSLLGQLIEGLDVAAARIGRAGNNQGGMVYRAP